MKKKSNVSTGIATPSRKRLPTKTTHIAVLDEGGVYQGMRDIPLADLAPEHVHLPDGCDLPPGRYRWDAENKTFIPLPKGDR